MTTATPPPINRREVKQPTRGQARFAFIILFIINTLNYADRYVLPAILRKVQASPQLGGIGLSDFEAGLIGSSFLIVYALATLPIGIWADRGIRKNIIAICVGIWSVATVLAGMTQNFVQMFSVRAILGIGEAGYAPASLSLLGDLFSKERRGRVLAYWSAGTLIGSAIGFALGGLIADAFGWRWAFFLVGIPGLISAFLAWRMSEPERGIFDRTDAQTDQQSDDSDVDDLSMTHGSIGSWQAFRQATGELLRIPTYWILLGALTFSFFTIGGASFWLPSYFAQTFQLSVGQAGIFSGIVLVSGGLIGTVAGGWLADYVQRRRLEGRLIVATSGFLLGAPLILIALFIHNLPLFVVVFIMAAIFLSFCTGPLNAVIQDVIKPSLRATAVGFSLLFAHLLGDASSPSLIGLIADQYHHDLRAALLLTAPTALIVAGLICLLGIRVVARDMKAMEAQIRHTYNKTQIQKTASH